MKRKQRFLLLFLVGMDLILLLVLVREAAAAWNQSHALNVSAGREIGNLKTTALTFDDGPNRNYTEKLLDGLADRGVKASFFLTGVCLEGNEEIVRRMAEEGHLIGVHCMQHTDLTQMKAEEAMEQLKVTSETIERITGQKPMYIRPPFGRWSDALDDRVREELQMEPVLWDVDSLDWKLQHVGKIMEKVMKDVENGDVILMHDEFPESVDAALGIIDNLMAKGYTFVTIDELMVD